MKKLTPKQQKILNFIRSFYVKNGHSPTVGEMMENLNISSKRGVTQYLETLEKKDYITREKYRERGIKLCKESSDFTQIPVVGSAGCDNMSVFAQETYDEYIPIQTELIRDKNYSNLIGILASGGSMEGGDIFDGDTVLIEKTEDINPEERVLAIVDGMAVVKRYFPQKDLVLLMPDSSDSRHKPLIVKDNFNIVGKVVMVVPTSITNDIRYEQINEDN